MENIFDDELDEYAEQQVNTPTVPASVPTAAPQQQKSAELAEMEKSLKILKEIQLAQKEMKLTMSELNDMAEKAQSLSEKLTAGLQDAKPIWDELMKSFTSNLVLSDESLEEYQKMMIEFSNKIAAQACSKAEQTVKENIETNFVEKFNDTTKDFKNWCDKVKWIFIGSIAWGVLATIFAVTTISRCSSAEDEAEEAKAKYEAVEPEMNRLRKNFYPLKKFAVDNPKTWEKWWKLNKESFPEAE